MTAGGRRASQGRVLGLGDATDTSAVERHGASVVDSGLAQIKGLALGQRCGASAAPNKTGVQIKAHLYNPIHITHLYTFIHYIE